MCKVTTRTNASNLKYLHTNSQPLQNSPGVQLENSDLVNPRHHETGDNCTVGGSGVMTMRPMWVIKAKQTTIKELTPHKNYGLFYKLTTVLWLRKALRCFKSKISAQPGGTWRSWSLKNYCSSEKDQNIIHAALQLHHLIQRRRLRGRYRCISHFNSIFNRYG